MALRQIRFEGDSILRKKTRNVENFDDKFQTLIDDMFETMYEAEGVGLAAPQIGILKKVVVIDVGEGQVVLANPTIIETDGKAIDAEGCLSVPGKSGEVERPTYVKVKAQDRNGNDIEIEGRDFFARAICHELDHLDGILYIDKVIRFLNEK